MFLSNEQNIQRLCFYCPTMSVCIKGGSIHREAAILCHQGSTVAQNLESNGSCSDSCVVASIRQMRDKAKSQLLSAKM